MAWNHNFKPPGGPGWGGPAKGASTSRYSADNPPDNKGAVVKGKIKAEALRMLLEGDIPEVASTWREVMKDKNQPGMTRLAAGEKIVERVLGKVEQVNVNRNTNDLSSLSDDELDAELARREGTPTGAAEGAGSAPDTAEPDDLVH